MSASTTSEPHVALQYWSDRRCFNIDVLCVCSPLPSGSCRSLHKLDFSESASRFSFARATNASGGTVAPHPCPLTRSHSSAHLHTGSRLASPLATFCLSLSTRFVTTNFAIARRYFQAGKLLSDNTTLYQTDFVGGKRTAVRRRTV